MLFSEHRAAPARAPVHLELVTTDAKTTHLEVIAELQDGNGKRRSLEERVLALLVQGVVLTRAKLRDSLAVQNERLMRKRDGSAIVLPIADPSRFPPSKFTGRKGAAEGGTISFACASGLLQTPSPALLDVAVHPSSAGHA